MFCTECGTKNQDDAIICRKCGSRLGSYVYAGKEKCEYLKSIRDRIAKENNIPYKSSPCTNMDPCERICPACEAEAAALREMLKEKREKGESLYIYGKDDLEAVNASPGDNLRETRIPAWEQPMGYMINTAGIPAEPNPPKRDSLFKRIKKAFGK